MKVLRQKSFMVFALSRMAAKLFNIKKFKMALF